MLTPQIESELPGRTHLRSFRHLGSEAVIADRRVADLILCLLNLSPSFNVGLQDRKSL